MDIIYAKKDDPDVQFEYIQTMINLELSAGSKLTKFITQDGRVLIQKTKEALDRYKRVWVFIQEYLKYKKIKEEDLEKNQMRQQIDIIKERIALLP